MSVPPRDQVQNDPDANGNGTDAMQDRLRRDVASWRDGRSGEADSRATELSVAVARSIVPPTSAKMKRPTSAAAPTRTGTADKKPFGMSYGGTSRSDYIKQMIARGAR